MILYISLTFVLNAARFHDLKISFLGCHIQFRSHQWMLHIWVFWLCVYLNLTFCDLFIQFRNIISPACLLEFSPPIIVWCNLPTCLLHCLSQTINKLYSTETHEYSQNLFTLKIFSLFFYLYSWAVYLNLSYGCPCCPCAVSAVAATPGKPTNLSLCRKYQGFLQFCCLVALPRQRQEFSFWALPLYNSSLSFFPTHHKS